MRLVKVPDRRESNGTVDLFECEAYVRKFWADYNVIQVTFDGY